MGVASGDIREVHISAHGTKKYLTDELQLVVLAFPVMRLPYISFPKIQRKKWIEQLKSTRDHWIDPSENSSLCSKHFTDDSYILSKVQERRICSKKY